MPHPHAFRWAGIALALLAPVTGCFEADTTGNPGPSFLSGSAGSSGGAGHAGSGGSSSSKQGTFAFAWSLEDGAGAASTCAGVAGDSVDIALTNLTTQEPLTGTFACTELGAKTDPLPAGRYALSMKLRDAKGEVLAEILAPELFLIAKQETPVGSLPFQVGGDGAAMGRGVAATWSIAQADTGATQTCAQAGAATVRLTVGPKTFDLPCADGKGRTTTIAPGSYSISLRLLDAKGGDLSVTQTMTLSVGAGQLLYLGNVPFDVL
jgi:hypothetical protein